MGKIGFYFFILLALLIGVAYYVGTVADAGALASGLQQVVYAITGRTPQGAFAAYPTGG